MTAGFSVFTATTDMRVAAAALTLNSQSAALGDSDALSLKPSWLTHICQHIHALKTTRTHPRTVC